MIDFLKKYSHIWTAAYALIYVPWFLWLERTITADSDYVSIHCSLDDVIPFCQYFIVPYYLWFLFVAAGFIFLFFTSRKEYYTMCFFLFSGMTIFLIICTLYPNGQDLRYDTSNLTGLFADTVRSLYKTDTNTNVFPSIHVFNSIGIAIGIVKSSWLSRKSYGKAVKILTCLLAFSIILSTMFLKQHSAIDAIGSIIMSIVLYFIVYVPNWKFMNQIKEFDDFK